jgi:hypothetical protein
LLSVATAFVAIPAGEPAAGVAATGVAEAGVAAAGVAAAGVAAVGVAVISSTVGAGKPDVSGEGMAASTETLDWA